MRRFKLSRKESAAGTVGIHDLMPCGSPNGRHSNCASRSRQERPVVPVLRVAAIGWPELGVKQSVEAGVSR